MKTLCFFLCILMSVCLFACQKGHSSTYPRTQDKIKALIVDGQNNHGGWPKTTMMMKSYLEETGLFTVDVARTAFTWQGPHNDQSFGKERREQLLEEFPLENAEPTTMKEKSVPDPNFAPDFAAYDVVISNLGWTAAAWPEATQKAFEDFVANGGGVVIVHAANNSFPEWEAYNKMIAIGGWGDRTERDGPYIYYDEEGKFHRDIQEGGAGSHGLQHEYVIKTRDAEHPIMKGLPTEWLHTKDELYDRLRGPAENVTVLATAFSDVEKNASNFSPLKGTGRHEPMLLTIDYEKGRVFHTVMGHTDYSFECVGFITTFQRGTEWAATGEVSLTDVPDDFPTVDKTSSRKWEK